MNDRQRVLAYLEEHGEVTSYEIRVKGLSGNPSQRINELRDEGHQIDGEDFRRDGRPCTRYTLRRVHQACHGEEVGVDNHHSSALRTAESRGGSSGTHPPVASISGEGVETPVTGGGAPPHPVALPTLFDMACSGPTSHYRGEAV
jgi:hypothetical protein